MDGNAALRDDAPTPAERLNSIAAILAAGIRRRPRHIDMGAPAGATSSIKKSLAPALTRPLQWSLSRRVVDGHENGESHGD
ncbi:MAG: hypothetical protein AB7Q00_09360 [Phycisphaerales bacterium]